MRLAAALALLALGSGTGSARTWFIAPDGAGDAPTIQTGIDSAAAGDTVALANGVFVGDGNRDVSFLGKAIVVRSAAGDPSVCAIDCEASITDRHRAFIFESSETEASSLEGVTIRNGWGPDAPPDNEASGGGIYCRSGSPTVRNCVFENDYATIGGALALWDHSAPRVSGCSFIANHANRDGGAVYLYVSCFGTIETSVFADNTAGNGGAVCANESSFPTIDGCTFTNNGAAIYGGGVYCALSSNATVRGCSFVGNRARHGGGVAAFSSLPAVTGCDFTENHADQKGGGMICISASDATIEECVFSINDADNGGGLACWSPNSAPVVRSCGFFGNRATHGGGIWASNSSPTITDCTIGGNHANDLGGGILCTEGASPLIERCRLVSNEGTRGGGLACWPAGSAPTVTATTFYANGAPTGSSVFSNGSRPEISRTILAEGIGGQAVSCSSPGDAPVFSCCDIHGHAGGDWSGCLADQVGIDGNFSLDPLFCGAGDGDFTLRGDSPCLPGQHPDGVACDRIGAFDEGCAGPTAVVPTSWGSVKSLFR